MSASPHVSVPPPRDELRAVFLSRPEDDAVNALQSVVEIIRRVGGQYAHVELRQSERRIVSRLLVGPRPPKIPCCESGLSLITCYHAELLEQEKLLDRAEEGAALLVNMPGPPSEAWMRLPQSVRELVIDRGIDLHVVDAHQILNSVGLDGGVDVVMMTAFFALSGALSREVALEHMQQCLEGRARREGLEFLRRAIAARDLTLERLHHVKPSCTCLPVITVPTIPPRPPPACG